LPFLIRKAERGGHWEFFPSEPFGGRGKAGHKLDLEVERFWQASLPRRTSIEFGQFELVASAVDQINQTGFGHRVANGARL
jgi:hypothetical protein